ncbi:MAG: hypothetical protein WED34_04905 [Planctomycetales bacterium]
MLHRGTEEHLGELATLADGVRSQPLVAGQPPLPIVRVARRHVPQRLLSAEELNQVASDVPPYDERIPLYVLALGDVTIEEHLQRRWPYLLLERLRQPDSHELLAQRAIELGEPGRGVRLERVPAERRGHKLLDAGSDPFRIALGHFPQSDRLPLAVPRDELDHPPAIRFDIDRRHLPASRASGWKRKRRRHEGRGRPACQACCRERVAPTPAASGSGFIGGAFGGPARRPP